MNEYICEECGLIIDFEFDRDINATDYLICPSCGGYVPIPLEYINKEG